jgi:hydroxymethylbilane synthase
MKRSLIIGSRGSKLALWQAEQTKSHILQNIPDLTVEIEILKTTGDVNRDPLSIIGGKGVFTKELEEALIDGRIDIAVHSLKDLPTVLPDKLTIAAICEREDPRDAVVLKNSAPITSLHELPHGVVVGTSSQRRLAQLKNIRPDIVIRDIRGNVDTRLRKLDAGEYDALILASAGLRRLGLTHRIDLAVSTSEMLPAVGQGAIAIETHVENEAAIEAVRQMADSKTTAACLAERAFLRSLGGGCQFPIAAHAILSGNLLEIDGLVSSPDGARILRATLSNSLNSPDQLGTALAQKLIQLGANELLQETLR